MKKFIISLSTLMCVSIASITIHAFPQNDTPSGTYCSPYQAINSTTGWWYQISFATDPNGIPIGILETKPAGVVLQNCPYHVTPTAPGRFELLSGEQCNGINGAPFAGILSNHVQLKVNWPVRTAGATETWTTQCPPPPTGNAVAF